MITTAAVKQMLHNLKATISTYNCLLLLLFFCSDVVVVISEAPVQRSALFAPNANLRRAACGLANRVWNGKQVTFQGSSEEFLDREGRVLFW